MDFDLSEEQRLLVDSARAFAAAELSPNAADWDRDHHFPTDVIRRAAALGNEVGCRALLVHCENIEARDFYLHHAPEFEASPTDELHLTLLMKDLLRLRG